jgi:pre-mRNA-splicing factor ISY1
MLYRFREAQAAELGLGTRSDRRPRMASVCRAYVNASDGEEKYFSLVGRCRRYKTVCNSRVVLSRSCILTFLRAAGPTDYEVWDLNDDINKFMREMRHWENQIISLGGANHRRNVTMLDDDGREVPGTKGYKYADPSPTKHLFAF